MTRSTNNKIPLFMLNFQAKSRYDEKRAKKEINI